MKKLILILGFSVLQSISWACPVCERQQPKVLRGITHGAGPESNMDYIIVWATVAIVMITLFFAIKWLIKPGEHGEDHIKRFIINTEDNG